MITELIKKTHSPAFNGSPFSQTGVSCSLMLLTLESVSRAFPIKASGFSLAQNTAFSAHPQTT